MLGRRLPDTEAGHLPRGWQAGDYWKVLRRDGSDQPIEPEEYGGAGDYSGNLTKQVWYVVTPLGQLAGLCLHAVREEDDGTISIRPGDGSSNSVLVHGIRGEADWHGYIEHGVWQPC